MSNSAHGPCDKVLLTWTCQEVSENDCESFGSARQVSRHAAARRQSVSIAQQCGRRAPAATHIHLSNITPASAKLTSFVSSLTTTSLRANNNPSRSYRRPSPDYTYECLHCACLIALDKKQSRRYMLNNIIQSVLMTDESRTLSYVSVTRIDSHPRY